MINENKQKICLTMNTEEGANFSLIITPPVKCQGVQPEPEKAPKAEKEPEPVKKDEPEKIPEADKTPEEDADKAADQKEENISDEEIKKILTTSEKKVRRAGRPKKSTEQILDEMARKRGEL